MSMDDESKICRDLAMIWGVDQREIAKIVHDFMKKDICCELDRINCPPPPIYIGPVKVKSLKERLEEAKMKKATSTQTIKNVKDISVTIENYPVEMGSKIIIVASTDDDIFEFEFEGSDLLQSCKAAGLFSGWEKDLKIKELREMNDDLEQEREAILEENDKLREEFDKVAEENKKLRNRINVLKRPKTPTFTDKEPTSRRDILKAAEKCVCGKREQDYGTPESNFQLIADLWNQYLFKEPGAKEIFGIGPMDVAMLMALMKIARIRNGGGSGDSFVDLAGYAACGGEIWDSNKETNGDSSQETN